MKRKTAVISTLLIATIVSIGALGNVIFSITILN